MVLRKNEGLLHNLMVILKGLFYSRYHLFLIYAFYSNLALSVFFFVQNQKLISYISLFIGMCQYIVSIIYDERYRRTQQKYNLLINCYDSLPSLFLILDKKWNVVFANDIFHSFSIGKTITKFEDVLECFSENQDLCKLLKKAQEWVEEKGYFCEYIEIDESKSWKVYLGLMKKLNKSFYVCYISDIQKTIKENIKEEDGILDNLPEGLLAHNNGGISYLNQTINNLIKLYNISLKDLYEDILEQDGKKSFFLSYKGEKGVVILKFERISQRIDQKNTINTYRIFINEQILLLGGVQDTATGVILLDDNLTILESNSRFNSLVGSYFVKKTNIFQYIDITSQGILRQFLKEKERNLTKESQPINIMLGDKTGNLVRVYCEKLQNCGWLFYIQDNSAQKSLEDQLLHLQRLASLGQALGSVSHDFNNILTAINGFCDGLSQKISITDERYFFLVQMRHNINRAVNLVKYILSFSSKSENKKPTPETEIIDVQEIIGNFLSNLGRLLGEGLTINFIRNEKKILIDLPLIGFEQILLNLIVNARDAMNNNGVVTISTNLIDSKVIESPNEILESGSYLELSVSDTGVGISEQNKKKIFDPFFTTKQEGTGLGLSTIYSIVKKAGGLIKFNSKFNMGTTFKIYLLAKESKKEKNYESKGSMSKDMFGLFSEARGEKKIKELNILLLEDDLSLRHLFTKSLEQKKHLKVYGFGSMQEAITKVKKMKEEEEELHLLIADVVMKDGNSLDLVNKIVLIYPKIKFLLISGHDREYLERLTNYKVLQEKEKEILFLQKPFSLDVLNSKIEEIYKKLND